MANNFTFTNVNFNEIQKADLADELDQYTELEHSIPMLVEVGFKVSFNTNERRDGVCASVTDRRKTSLNKDAILNSWAGSPSKALAWAMVYMEMAETAKQSWADYAKTIDREKENMFADFADYIRWRDRHTKDTGASQAAD